MDPTWFAAVAQTGAMGILAYHFLVGLPAILARISEEQRAERTFWAQQVDKDRAEFSRRAEMIGGEIRRQLADRANRNNGPD
jgi:hypothetical protein